MKFAHEICDILKQKEQEYIQKAKNEDGSYNDVYVARFNYLTLKLNSLLDTLEMKHNPWDSQGASMLHYDEYGNMLPIVPIENEG